MLRNKFIALNATVLLGISSVLAAPAVSAESISDLESKKSKIQDQRSGLESKVNTAEKKIAELKAQQEQTKAEMKKLDDAIGETNLKIREKNAEITKTKQEIEKLKQEIAELKERIEKRNEVLKKRALTFQENGGSANYLEVIFGASDFGDFIERVSAVSTIMEADEDLVKKHEEDKKQLEQKQEQVESKLASLESMKKELETMKAKLSKQAAEKDKLLAELKKEEENTHSYKMTLEEENELLKAQQTSITKAIELEQKRQAELEAARKKAAAEAAEAAKKKSAASSSSSSSSSPHSNVSSGSSGSGSSNSGSSSSNVSKPSVSAGAFTRPANGTLTSGLGERWGSFHAGVDIANSAGTPIVAAADGVVARSAYSSSYGNVVYITHSINGQIYTTVYAHMESRAVSMGQTVSKGQYIGAMGNTGDSQGNHLHFELHKGSWTPSKSGAINPIGIVPL
ncbi:MAG: murein hydrolase activator EnvC family protein [Bacillus sp. (in: firmicutes)]